MPLLSGSDENEKESAEEEVSECDIQHEPCHWTEATAEEMLHNLGGPIPEASYRKAKFQQAKYIVKWVRLFLIYWQLVCHASDNGLEWLLCFLFKMLGVVNSHYDYLFFKKLLVLFPTSMYLVRKTISLDRDYFTKFVVCSKCKKL